ncbi:hypothetical protein B0J12DRAFT_431244 [Macrophomina phaseolina]|uniref:Uncharacterized protein n=1 Tax=Macrophomina phaseolina TaxID=35725 RepID=A0ABQ8GK72_9PEZI|nr:hypothetical protein B0J12DRAFT_431244 [Macrophomina phaseolina]
MRASPLTVESCPSSAAPPSAGAVARLSRRKVRLHFWPRARPCRNEALLYFSRSVLVAPCALRKFWPRPPTPTLPVQSSVHTGLPLVACVLLLQSTLRPPVHRRCVICHIAWAVEATVRTQMFKNVDENYFHFPCCTTLCMASIPLHTDSISRCKFSEGSGGSCLECRRHLNQDDCFYFPSKKARIQDAICVPFCNFHYHPRSFDANRHRMIKALFA